MAAAGLMIRDAEVADARAIAAIARVTWADAYRGLIPDSAQRRFLDVAYQLATLRRYLARETEWFFVAERAGQVVGFAEFGHIADDTVELMRLYVLPEHQRSGLGGALLRHGVACLAACDNPPARLLVRTGRDNRPALAFYQRHGFTSIADDVHVYGGAMFPVVVLALAPTPPEADGF